MPQLCNSNKLPSDTVPLVHGPYSEKQGGEALRDISQDIFWREWESPGMQITEKCRSALKASISPGSESHSVNAEAEDREAEGLTSEGKWTVGEQGLKQGCV